MITSKKVLVFLSAVVLCLSLSMGGPVPETNASTCYRLYLDWDCTGVYTDYLSMVMHDDLTFDEEHGGYGDWGYYGPSRYIQFYDGCQEFLGGTVKQGFAQCTDGSYPGSENLPGCWFMKKAKSYECDWYWSFSIPQAEGSEGAFERDASEAPLRR